MCIRVQYVSAWEAVRPYDATRRLIRIPAQLDGPRALHAVRAVLAELAVEQPPFGARCFCGESVRFLSTVSERVTGGQAVKTYGA